MQDPYTVLGVAQSATQDEIRKAYRKLARQYHPDMNQGKPEAEAKFKDISHAYDLIGSEEKRKKYEDEKMKEKMWNEQQSARRGPFYYQTQSDANDSRYGFSSDFDADLFSRIFDQSQGARARAGARDQHYQMEINVEDAALGGEREITLPSGRRVRVSIPAGLHDGQTIRLKGLGEPGPDGKTGDAYITFHIQPSERFRLNGFDIESDLPLAIDEAVLGAEVQAPVVDGNVSVKIPAGANTGRRVRIKGRGARRPDGGRGDHYFSLKVVLPTTIDPELETAMRTWSREHHYNPRETGARP